jgi:hypothetical protein
MAEPLINIPQSELHPTIAALSDAGADTDDAEWIRKGRNAQTVVEFIREQRRAAEAQAVPAVNRPERANPPYWTYPARWKMATDPRVGKLKEYFPELDFSHVEELAARYIAITTGGDHVGGYRDVPRESIRKVVLPEGMDGLVVIPKIEAVARLVKKPPKGWKPVNLALMYLLEILKRVYGKGFHDGSEGRHLGPQSHQLYAHTEQALAQDAANTPGDVHVLAVQTGQLFAGYSADAVRTYLTAHPLHFGLHCVGGASLMLAYPERFAEGALWLECPGSGFASHGRPFEHTPIWCRDGHQLRFYSNEASRCNPRFGSGTFVLPELL